MTSKTHISLLYAVTASMTAQAFLEGQLRHMAGYTKVGLVVGDEPPEALLRQESVVGFSIGLSREPSPMSDLVALSRLIRVLRGARPDTVVFGTPKMALLCGIATWLCRVPRRVYIVHGLRWEGLYGPARRALQHLDALTCRMSTHVVAVSPSVKARLCEVVGLDDSKVQIIHHGTANGIDTKRFSPMTPGQKAEIRRSMGLHADATVYAFVGRLTRDKGLTKLPAVWSDIQARVPGSRLIVVGQPEPSDEEDRRALRQLANHSSIIVLPPTRNIESILGITDVNISLSRREGMGMVILEAASCEVPTVAYEVTGVVDAVAQGTGELVPLDSLSKLVDKAVALGQDTDLRKEMGMRARLRVEQEFSAKAVWDSWAGFLFSDETGR